MTSQFQRWSSRATQFFDVNLQVVAGAEFGQMNGNEWLKRRAHMRGKANNI